MIKWKKFSNILLIYFNFQFLFIQSYITLPFEYINKNIHNSNTELSPIASYFDSYMENSIYTTIKVNNKNIKFYLSFDRYATFISESTLNQLDIRPTLSYDEEKLVKLYSLEYIGIPKTSFGSSSFIFLQNNTNSISINDLSFFISQKKLEESTTTKKTKCLSDNNEEIGLNIYKGNKVSEVIVEQDDPFEDYYPDDSDIGGNPYDSDYDNDNEKTNYNQKKGERYINKNNGFEIEEQSNLINQLKSHKLISSYAFTIKYDNKNERGEIIIGSLPHEYDPRHYSEKYFAYSTVSFRKESPAWRIIFDNIKYGETKFLSTNLAEFNINFGFISASITHKQIFDTNFFSRGGIAPYCKEEKINSYYIKYCEEKVIKEFKPISFDLPRPYNSHKNDKIELNYQDLFLKCPNNNNYYCFQIVFGNSNWILGKPLFKKYNMVFDQEKKIVGFYKETGEYEYEEKNENQKSRNSIPWIIILILLICLIGLGFAFYKKLPFIKRKKIANELDDEFVYELAVKKNNGENKEQLFNS